MKLHNPFNIHKSAILYISITMVGVSLFAGFIGLCLYFNNALPLIIMFLVAPALRILYAVFKGE